MSNANLNPRFHDDTKVLSVCRSYGRIYSLIVLFSLVFFGSHVSARTSAAMPLSVVMAEQDLQQVGQAKFSLLFWDIYDSKLSTSSGRYPVRSDKQSVLFEINYLRDISQQELIERTVEQWQHLGMSQREYASYIPLLEQMWPDIQAGDSLALLIDARGNRFYFNNKFIGDIRPPQFGPRFLAIWLSVNTSQPKLRQQLLGEQ